MSIVDKLSCAHCGAPLPFEPGEIIATCKYCGFTVVIETGKAFVFDHSMLRNKYDEMQVEESIRDWMHTGFMKPSDLAKKSQITEKKLVYLPFWIITADAETIYKGIFERITPPVVKEGRIQKKYNWLVLARKATEFPTKAYDVPLEGKVPYDFRVIEGFAEAFNSEVDKDAAVEQAEHEIEEHQRHLIEQDVDKIIEINTKTKVNQTVYLHAPVWFVKYRYKGRTYGLLMDGATGTVIKADIPTGGFGIL